MLCVNLCVKLAMLRDVQIAGKLLFLYMSMRVSEEKLLNQQTKQRRSLSQMQISIIQSVEDLNRTKTWGKGKFSLLKLSHPRSSALRHQSSWISSFQTQTGIYTIAPLPKPILRPLELDRIIPLAFPQLQLADSRLQDSSASIPMNSYNKFRHTYLCIAY